MTPEQFALAERLFTSACDLATDRRIGFLQIECAGDTVVLHKVMGMLAQDELAPKYLDAPALGVGFHVSGLEDVERKLREELDVGGRYRLLETLGEGGFGTVYRAEQMRPVHRTVALKVIKPGMDTKRIIARFEAERQTLARMDHPGIARIIDAGATESGRPFFVMELVDGIPLTRYCDRHTLTVEQRLDLFILVCRAVHHAHQKGVIHRDIKPSNVLVAVQDGRPTPKLIDFGIAHAMDDFEMAGTLLTERGQLIGTPEYMSPEQAAGHRDIDTRTDVYALGVLLYELLAGATPFDRASWENSGLVHLQRVIREQEPPAPSARVKGLGGKAAQIAQTRRADQASLYKKLHGDLDWIIMKALEKDRARRYGTVDAFAGDIDRYRTLEPVSARAPTRTYRLRKFARRNRAALTIGLVIVVLLVGGVVGTSIGMIRARREAQIARTESEVARAVSAFLNDDLLAAVADQATGHDVGMRKILDVASKRIEGRFQDQPAAELAIRSSLGRAYKYLGEFLLARQHLERAIALSRQANVVAPTQRIDALLLLADVCNALEEPTGAEPLLAEALPHAIVLEGDAGWYPLLIRNSLAQTYRRLHRPADAEALYRRVIDIRRGMGDAVDNQRELLTTMSNLGALYYSQDRFDEAYVIASEVHIRAGPLLGADHLITMKATFDLARLMGRRGQLTAAGELLDPLVVTMRRKLGENHPNVYFVVAALASVRRDQGRLDESLDLRLESFEGFRRAYGEANTLTQGEIGELVTLYQKLECPEDVDLWQARQIEPGS